MSYAFDSNILLRSIEANHPHQHGALGVINKLVGRGAEIVLLPQTLYEFWVVATRPTGKENGLGLNAEATTAVIAKFESFFPFNMMFPKYFICGDSWLLSIPYLAGTLMMPALQQQRYRTG